VFEIDEGSELVVGTAQGTVKRVVADYPSKDEFEVIALKEGDQVVGGGVAIEAAQLVFVTSDAQVLRFDGKVVRAQGRAASGVAGINLSENAKAIYFGQVLNEATDTIITAANSSTALAGTDAGTVKLSIASEFPMKGRATGGVRGHKMLRNEDQIYFAHVSNGAAVALATDGKPIELPEPTKRDASGNALQASIGGVGTL
jgi:DNA gyrase subunit A